MRKPRVIIYDDDPIILDVLEHFFSTLNYEVLSFNEPVSCPIYERNLKCLNANPCADIITTDFQMPRMNGVELLAYQTRRGCKTDSKNKAVISGHVPEEYISEMMKLGCAFFKKPLSLTELSTWVKECESRIDLSQPLGVKRRALRHSFSQQIKFSFNAQDPKFEGNVVNISDFGLCLKASINLFQDQTLRIHTELPNSCKKASVRWMKRLDMNGCLAGLSCS